jgi:hypothetical protein
MSKLVFFLFSIYETTLASNLISPNYGFGLKSLENKGQSFGQWTKINIFRRSQIKINADCHFANRRFMNTSLLSPCPYLKLNLANPKIILMVTSSEVIGFGRSLFTRLHYSLRMRWRAKWDEPPGAQKNEIKSKEIWKDNKKNIHFFITVLSKAETGFQIDNFINFITS